MTRLERLKLKCEMLGGLNANAWRNTSFESHTIEIRTSEPFNEFVAEGSGNNEDQAAYNCECALDRFMRNRNWSGK